MSRPAALIELSEKERGELEGLSRRRRTAQGLAQRAQIVLLAADGLENKAIAHRTGVVENTVGKWSFVVSCHVPVRSVSGWICSTVRLMLFFDGR
jgi:hypothetical protein